MDEKSGAALSGAERLEARRKAEERLAVVKAQNAKALEDYAKARQVEVAKTARLRALRLARDAAEPETAANPVPDTVAVPPAPEASAAPKRAKRRKSPLPAMTNPGAPLGGEGET
jgi:hypothetical protein